MHHLGSLANNALCSVTVTGGTCTVDGINALCDAIKGNTTLTSLKYASQLEPLPTYALTAHDVHTAVCQVHF